jgi:hypothetical protein
MAVGTTSATSIGFIGNPSGFTADPIRITVTSIEFTPPARLLRDVLHRVHRRGIRCFVKSREHKNLRRACAGKFANRHRNSGFAHTSPALLLGIG